MRSRQRISELVTALRDTPVPEVRTTYEALRDDLATSCADLAGDILLHQERCEEGMDALPDDRFDDPDVEKELRTVDLPLWSLIVEDFRRLARWVPRQRLARFGEADAIHFFRERLIGAMRPALVELQRAGVLRNGEQILRDDFWAAENLYDLAVRHEGFTLALYRAIQRRINHDRQSLESLAATG